MHTHRLRTLLWIAAALPATAWSQVSLGVPTELTFSGRLASGGVALNGQHDFVFTLYTATSGGTSVWTESHLAQTVTNGYVAIVLGTTTPLDQSVLTGSALYLEVNVDQTTLTPRVPALSVPYAVRAGTANNVCAATPSGASDAGVNCSPGLPGAGGRSGYAQVQCAAPGCSVPTSYAFNSTGGAVTATRGGSGNYTVQFAGLGSGANGNAGGNVQVSSQSSGVLCSVPQWNSFNSSVTVTVSCVSLLTAAPTEANFSVIVVF
jgi:hypothetical protein